MRKLWLCGAVLVLASSQVHALSGPANGGYIWVTSPGQSVYYDHDNNPGTPDKLGAYYDIHLEAIKVNSNYYADTGHGLVSFTPDVPSDHVNWGHPQNQHGPSELGGMPTIYRNSTTDGYGQLLVGAYTDNDPAYCMDIVHLAPQSGGALTQTVVHDGRLDVSGQFHTEDASAVHYDRDGQWCMGVPDSVLVTGEVQGMTSRTDGFCTDTDGDGQFDDVGGSTETYVNLSNLPGKKVLYKNYLFAQTGWLGTTLGINYGGADGIIQHRRNADNSITSSVLYNDHATYGGTLDFAGAGLTSGPSIAVGDVNNNGIPDLFWAGYTYYWDHDNNPGTPDGYSYFIGWCEDKDNDGNTVEAGEYSLWCLMGRQNGPYAPWDPDNTVFTANGGWNPFAVVQGEDNSFAVLAYSPGHWSWGPTYVALGVADNGEFSGEAVVIATALQASGSNPPWPILGSSLGGAYDLWDPIGTPIPEPGTLLLLGTGLIGAVGYVRRRRMR